MYTPASDLFERVIDDLRTRYDEFGFHTERDVVWTIQKELVRRIRDSSVALRVVNDYPILPGNRRSLTADLAILDAKGAVEVAAEFKYEPAHSRQDIWPTKVNPSVIFWGKDGAGADIERVHRFVEQRV